jgi:hypothetical protein
MKHLETVFAIVSSRLPAANVHCLLIGGFAVNHYGYSRNTLDVDFMISGDELDRVKQVMTQEGFTNVAVHENVVFFTMPGNPLRIDFLRVDAGTMQRLLSNAVTVRLHEHELKVPALKDLIAMKIFALAQGGAKRQGKDLPDIAYLTVINNLDLESDILPLCDRFGNPRTYTLVKEYVEALQSP